MKVVRRRCGFLQVSSELDKVAERPDILGGKAQRPLEPLDLSRHHQQALAPDDGLLALVKVGADHNVDHPRLILKEQKEDAPGRLRPLPGDDETSHITFTSVASFRHRFDGPDPPRQMRPDELEVVPTCGKARGGVINAHPLPFVHLGQDHLRHIPCQRERELISHLGLIIFFIPQSAALDRPPERLGPAR